MRDRRRSRSAPARARRATCEGVHLSVRPVRTLARYWQRRVRLGWEVSHAARECDATIRAPGEISDSLLGPVSAGVLCPSSALRLKRRSLILSSRPIPGHRLRLFVKCSPHY